LQNTFGQHSNQSSAEIIGRLQNGHEIFFIATSDNQTAAAITNQTSFKVNVSPVLSKAPEYVLNQAYGFTNGIPGAGPFGFQLPVVAVVSIYSREKDLLYDNC
jgi:hypothetical protein